MSSNYGSSGSPFDQLEIFTFEEAARALVFDRTGQIVPALASRLTPLATSFMIGLLSSKMPFMQTLTRCASPSTARKLGASMA